MKRIYGLLKNFVYIVATLIVYLGSYQVVAVAKEFEMPQVRWNEWNKEYLTEIFNIKMWLEDTTMTKSEKNIKVIDRYLEYNFSPMVGNGRHFVRYAEEYDIPVYLMPAIAGAESCFGKYGYASEGTYNAVGMGIHEQRIYTNWETGIEDMAKVLRNYYFDEGKDTTIEIQNKWAPRCDDGNSCDNSWAENVDFFISEMQQLENEINRNE